MRLPWQAVLRSCAAVLLVAFLLAAAALRGKEPDGNPRRDRFGNSLPAGAIVRLGPARPGQGGAVLAVGFSPDGKVLASAGTDGVIHLWDRASGRERARFEEKPHVIHAVAFSPDGRALAAARHDGVISLWDGAAGERRRELRGHEDVVKTLTFAPSGILASGGVDETIRFWDVTTGKQVSRLDPGQSWIEALAYAPDGKVLACGTPYETIRLWDVATGREVARLGQKTDGFLALAFSPDGRTLAAAGKTSTIRLLEVATGQVRGKLPGHWDCVSSLAFAPDGRFLASGSADRSVRLWDLAAAKEVCRWEGHRDAIHAIALARDGAALASASKDTTALVWDLSAPVRGVPSGVEKPSREEVRGLWVSLGSEDAVAAYRALWRLAAAPQASVALVRDRLQPLSAGEPERMARLVRDLDDDAFAVREQATVELARLGTGAEPALRKALAGRPSEEVRRRIDALLARLQTPETAEARRRWRRAVELLELVGSDEARAALKLLAGGTTQAPGVTVEAQASLERLGRRAAQAP